MQAAEIIRIVNSITYKPGYRIVAEQLDIDVIRLTLLVEVPDSNDPSRNAHLKLIECFSPFACRDRRLLFVIVRSLLERFEMHEMDEWLKVDGVRVTEPHK